MLETGLPVVAPPGTVPEPGFSGQRRRAGTRLNGVFHGFGPTLGVARRPKKARLSPHRETRAFPVVQRALVVHLGGGDMPMPDGRLHRLDRAFAIQCPVMKVARALCG